MHGLDVQTLVHDGSVLLPFSRVGGADKWTVRFRQELGGVPVIGGALNVLMDAESGSLLSVQSTGIPRLAGASLVRSLSSELARPRAARYFEDLRGVPAGTVSEPELCFVQVTQGVPRRAVLAWQMDLRFELADALPEAWRAG